MCAVKGEAAWTAAHERDWDRRLSEEELLDYEAERQRNIMEEQKLGDLLDHLNDPYHKRLLDLVEELSEELARVELHEQRTQAQIDALAEDY